MSKRKHLLFIFIFSCIAGALQTSALTPPNHAEFLNADQLRQYQGISGVIDATLLEQKAKNHLTNQDIRNWTVSDIYSNQRSGTTYIYLHQQYNSIRIYNAVSSMAIQKGKVVSFANRFYSDVENKVNVKKPSITPVDAIAKAAAYLGLNLTQAPALMEKQKQKHLFVFSNSGISREPIKVNLLYQPLGNNFRLAWNVNIYLMDKSHWWNVRIDAVTGEFLAKNDWTTHCEFGGGAPGLQQTGQVNAGIALQTSGLVPMNPARQSTVPVYNVYPLPVESPIHGSRALLTDPSDAVASPFGWHDDNGATGPEYTITRGNNVFAYDDIADQNNPGFSPDGLAALNFDFPLNFSLPPSGNLSACVTNLFYVNNKLHDIAYHYGFDEVSGNYQANNYGHGGAGNDYVFAEAQDGGGSSNANFSAPDDGQNGTMQMYLWSNPGSQEELVVNSPGSIAGNDAMVSPTWGAAISSPITGNLVLAIDGTAPVTDACDPLVNSAALSGNIAVIDRGLCNFVDKVLAVQAAGAIAAIIVNNVAGAPFAMADNGSGSQVTIPAVMISQTDGIAIENVLNTAGTVNATMTPPLAFDFDGDLDNGVICHEYGHGISVRLTGGPSNSNCLDNGEEGGEGWSDWLALMMTIQPGDHGSDPRPMGPYVLGEPVTGSGIRRYPYSTDMSVDPETYGYLAQSNEVHDIGEVWCSTIWDMSWALIDQFGFDPDWYSGTSGNNIAMQLVMEGMKLQPCSPGFLDARDAILQADDNLYTGVHKCLIWSAFARRGMGANALQGSANTAGDETEDFALPTVCLIPTTVPTANFTSDRTTTCMGTIQFTDLSTNIAQSWFWDFGDGTNSTSQNPSHTYTASGVYDVKLVSTNTIGSDSLTQAAYITVNFPTTPLISGNTALCPGDSSVLSATVTSGNTAQWSDSSGSTVLATDTVFSTPSLNISTTYSVREITTSPIQYVGPPNDSFGTGGYYNGSTEGRLLFTAYTPFKLKSAWVDASTTANRTIHLYNASGTLIQTLTLNIPLGQSRINLNFDIPSAGNYQIGVLAAPRLYRNTTGAAFPYNIGGMVSITTSNFSSSPNTHYYYLYDWEVQETPCQSPPVYVPVNVAPGPFSNFTFSGTGLTTQFTDASNGAVSWSWDFGDLTNSQLPNPVMTYAQAGTYTVTLTVANANGCQSVSTQILTVTDAGIQVVDANPIRIYSTGNQIFVQFEKSFSSEAGIRVTDVLGRELSNVRFRNGNLYAYRVEDLDAGYVLISVKKEGQTIHKKVFVSRD